MKLKYARIEVGITQGEFAKIMGVSQTMVCLWEKGKNLPCKKKREKIKAFFKEKGIEVEFKVL